MVTGGNRDDRTCQDYEDGLATSWVTEPLSDVATLNKSPFPPCLCYFLSLIDQIKMVAELGLLAARIQALTLTTPVAI